MSVTRLDSKIPPQRAFRNFKEGRLPQSVHPHRQPPRRGVSERRWRSAANRPSRQARRCHRKAMTEGVTAERSRRGDKIPAGGSPEEFSCPARSRAHPLPPPTHKHSAKRVALWRGRGRKFYTSHFKGGDGRQWRPSIAGLRCHSGRSWTRPTGAQDPSRQARRCRRRRRKGFPGRFPSPTPALGKIPSPLAMGGRSVV